MTERRPSDPVERRRRLNERLRAAWVAGAETEWRKATGRPMTREELQRVLRRYPGTSGDRCRGDTTRIRSTRR